MVQWWVREVGVHECLKKLGEALDKALMVMGSDA